LGEKLREREIRELEREREMEIRRKRRRGTVRGGRVSVSASSFFKRKSCCYIFLTKNMSNPKPDCPTEIKTSIPSITKHPQNISPNSKHSTNQEISF